MIGNLIYRLSSEARKNKNLIEKLYQERCNLKNNIEKNEQFLSLLRGILDNLDKEKNDGFDDHYHIIQGDDSYLIIKCNIIRYDSKDLPDIRITIHDVHKKYANSSLNEKNYRYFNAHYNLKIEAALTTRKRISIFNFDNRDSINEPLHLWIYDIQSGGNNINKGYGTIAMEKLISIAKLFNCQSINGEIGIADFDHLDRLEHFYKKFEFDVKINLDNKSGSISKEL